MSSLSYEALCLPLRQDLLGLARRYTQNGADDLVQDTFIKAYLSWDLFKQETDNLARDVKVWLRRILTNTYYTQWKREQRRNEVHDVEFDVEPLPEEENNNEQLHLVIDKLPVMYKDIITRHYFQGQSYDEIMHELSIPLTQVQKRLWRGRQYIKKALGRAVESTATEPTKKLKIRKVRNRVTENANIIL